MLQNDFFNNSCFCACGINTEKTEERGLKEWEDRADTYINIYKLMEKHKIEDIRSYFGSFLNLN